MPLSMERWVGKVAVVTGASAGIGAAIAEALVDEGVKVVGISRRRERVEELAKKLEGSKGKLYPFKADIVKEEDILEAFKWTKENLGPVHILVNNAGVIAQNTLIEGDTELWKKILDTNVMGLCIATREAVKGMRESNVDGHIIHINSVLGHYIPNFPNVNMYGASKYAVTALTETLRNELNSIGSKTKITSISPGFVRTEIMEAAEYKMTPEMEQMAALESKDIADSTIYVLSTPPHVQMISIKQNEIMNCTRHYFISGARVNNKTGRGVILKTDILMFNKLLQNRKMRYY